MVELMWSYISAVENDYDKYMDKENVEDLLTLMELAGILPPETKAPSWHRQTTINVWDEESPVKEQKDLLNEENQDTTGRSYNSTGSVT